MSNEKKISNAYIDNNDLVVRNRLPPYPIPDVSVAEYFYNIIQKQSESFVLVIDPETDLKMTYGEFLLKTKNFASGLIDAGLNKNNIVLLFGLNSFDYLISWFGVVWTGLIFSPVTPAHGQFELTEQIKNSKASVLILDYQLLPVLNSALANEKYSASILKYLQMIIVMNSMNETVTIQANIMVKTFQQMIEHNCKPIEQIPHYPTTINDRFMYIYTSGSTGLPKGAIHTNYSWIYSLFCTQFAPYYLPQFILWHPFGHVSGIWATMASFLIKGTIILFKIGNLDKLLQCIAKYKLDWFAIGQPHINKMIELDYSNKYDLSSLKYIWLAGSKASKNEIELITKKYKAKFVEFYSSTEFMCGLRIDDWEYGSANIGNIGRPLPGVEAKIVDLTTGENLPANQNGEVCLRGPNIFAGYLDNEEATRSTIDNDGWYHSGDVGHYDETGAFYIVDRIKAMIKFRSWSIFPTEIEHLIAQHPAVASVCVVGIKHVEDGYHLRAYVQTKTGKQVDKEEIINLVHENMGFQKRLRAGVEFVDKLPLTNIGKVDRKSLANLTKNELLTNVVE